MALVVGARTKEELGLEKNLPPGAARLLAALVKRGLGPEHLRGAAALALVLEAEALRRARSRYEPSPPLGP